MDKLDVAAVDSGEGEEAVVLCDLGPKRRKGPKGSTGSLTKLPRGWSRFFKTRKSGASKGKWDQYFRSPEGKIFDSLTKAQRAWSSASAGKPKSKGHKGKGKGKGKGTRKPSKAVRK